MLKSILAVRGSGIDLPPGETRSDFFSTATIRFFCDFHHASRGNFRTFVAYAIGASLKVQGPGRPPGRMQACKGLRRPPTSQGRGLVTATDGIRSACNPFPPEWCVHEHVAGLRVRPRMSKAAVSIPAPAAFMFLKSSFNPLRPQRRVTRPSPHAQSVARAREMLAKRLLDGSANFWWFRAEMQCLRRKVGSHCHSRQGATPRRPDTCCLRPRP